MKAATLLLLLAASAHADEPSIGLEAGTHPTQPVTQVSEEIFENDADVQGWTTGSYTQSEDASTVWLRRKWIMPELPNGCLRPNGTFKSTTHECVMDDECLMDCQVVERENFYRTKEYTTDTCDLSCGCTFISNFNGTLTCIDGIHSCDRGTYGPGPNGKLCCTEDLGSITWTGQLALYVAFLAMFCSSGLFAYEAFQAPMGGRFMYFMAMFTTLIASLAYLTMSVGYGYYFMMEPCRQFWYARYVDWALTTPLMLYEMCYIARASKNTIFWLVGVDFLMILTGLIGAFVGQLYDTNDRWLFFGFGLLMFWPIVALLRGNGKDSLPSTMQRAVDDESDPADEDDQNVFGRISLITVVTWTAYPVVWFLCEGTNRLGADMEMVAYAGLDVVSKCVWGFAIIGLRDSRAKKASQPLKPVA